MPEKSRPTTGDTPADVSTAAPSTTPRRSEGPRIRPRNGVDRYFEISARRSTVARELRDRAQLRLPNARMPSMCPLLTVPFRRRARARGGV